ncbi:uncharacterized protein LOC144146580 [Haemaphysalis longicornis]
MKELCAAGFSQEMSQGTLAKLFNDYLSVDIRVEVLKMHVLGRRLLRNLELSCLAKCILELLPKQRRSSVKIRLHSRASNGKVEGEVYCTDAVSAWEAAKFLESKEICLDWNFPPHQRLPLLFIETKLKIQFRLPAAVFLTTQKWFRDMFCIEGLAHTVTNVNSLGSLEFQGSNFGSIAEAVKVLNWMLRGSMIVDASWPVSLEQVAEAVKAAVSANKIYMYCKPQTIHLIGGAQDIQEAEHTLRNWIRETDQCNRKNLVLVSEEFSMLRSFLATYGDNLSKLAEEWELCGVEFHPNLKSIEVTGTESAIEKAEKLMQELPKQRPKSVLHASGESCPVCGLPSMSSPKRIRLESCGHWHCIQCLQLALKVAPLPLVCFNTTCRKPWMPADISNVTKNRPSLVSEYAQRSAYFGITEDSSSQGQVCPTPECDFVWSSEICSESQKSVTYRGGPICSKCTNAVCLKCRSLFHYGMSCAAFMASLPSQGATESETRRRPASHISQHKSPQRKRVLRSSSPAWPGSWVPGGGRNEKLPLLPANVMRLGKGRACSSDTNKPLQQSDERSSPPAAAPPRATTTAPQGFTATASSSTYKVAIKPREHFNILSLPTKEIKEVLKEVAAEKQQRNSECLVVVLSSHGHEQGLYGTDGYCVDLQQIYDLFDNNNCPALQGKPKLFFIQACRGVHLPGQAYTLGGTHVRCFVVSGVDAIEPSDVLRDTIRCETHQVLLARIDGSTNSFQKWNRDFCFGLMVKVGTITNSIIAFGNFSFGIFFSFIAGEWDSGATLTDEVDAGIIGEHSRSSVHNELRLERMPTRSDMYIAHSTSPGYVSYRDTLYGSWYLRNVYKVFSSHAWKLPLRQLLGQVREEVMKMATHDGSRQTPWLNECGGTKELYFNPGCRL